MSVYPPRADQPGSLTRVSVCPQDAQVHDSFRPPIWFSSSRSPVNGDVPDSLSDGCPQNGHGSPPGFAGDPSNSATRLSNSAIRAGSALSVFQIGI